MLIAPFLALQSFCEPTCREHSHFWKRHAHNYGPFQFPGKLIPLIRKKYALLILLTPLVLIEAVLQSGYFTGLRADVITSCCGSLFNPEAGSVTSDIAALPRLPMQIVFFACSIVTILVGIWCIIGKPSYGVWYLFAVLSAVVFVVSALSLISFISLYFYELPTHHCPFCILQKEYWYSGYILYLTLLGGAAAGIGTGVLNLFIGLTRLRDVVPVAQRKLAFLAVACFSVFTAITMYTIIASPLKLN